MSVSVEGALNSDGTIKLRTLSYSGINDTATDDNIYNVGVALGSCCAGGAQAVVLTEKYDLVQE
ncbi:MAG: DUF1659 domain-containing protein [Phascolarctobacterium sp.]|nr:DUF1659 domain-containing protein [Phascolarctobacterium sp.]